MKFILVPIIAMAIAQLSKFAVRENRRKISWRNLVAYSGMPSSHTATVISLVTVVAFSEGITSPLFAFALIFAFIVVNDAIRLRNYLGQHGKALNTIVKDLKEDDLMEDSVPKMLEKIGHTPAQVLVGALIGIVVGILGYYLL
jgi:hypothetical protein